LKSALAVAQPAQLAAGTVAETVKQVFPTHNMNQKVEAVHLTSGSLLSP
jgi:hypothetical protein